LLAASRLPFGETSHILIPDDQQCRSLRHTCIDLTSDCRGHISSHLPWHRKRTCEYSHFAEEGAFHISIPYNRLGIRRIDGQPHAGEALI